MGGLFKELTERIRVPTVYKVIVDETEGTNLTKFCILMEEMSKDAWQPFSQATNPMTKKDFKLYLKRLAGLHACCWDMILMEEQPGLGHFEPHSVPRRRLHGRV